MNNKDTHSATDSYLGYVYQAAYALTKLLDVSDPIARVSIETFDDVYLEEKDTRTLYQLKHSMKPNQKISIKSIKLWKSLKVWMDFCRQGDPAESTFVLVTVCDIDKKSNLASLLQEGSDRTALINDLIGEATRIKNAYDIAVKANEKIPHADKINICQEFLELPDYVRDSLIKSVIITQTFFILSY